MRDTLLRHLSNSTHIVVKRLTDNKLIKKREGERERENVKVMSVCVREREREKAEN